MRPFVLFGRGDGTMKTVLESSSEALLFNKRIWRVQDVAEFLQCSVGHVYNLVSDERIPNTKKGKFVFFVPISILEWVLEGETK